MITRAKTNVQQYYNSINAADLLYEHESSPNSPATVPPLPSSANTIHVNDPTCDALNPSLPDQPMTPDINDEVNAVATHSLPSTTDAAAPTRTARLPSILTPAHNPTNPPSPGNRTPSGPTHPPGAMKTL